jgi:hypothetical protein
LAVNEVSIGHVAIEVFNGTWTTTNLMWLAEPVDVRLTSKSRVVRYRERADGIVKLKAVQPDLQTI